MRKTWLVLSSALVLLVASAAQAGSYITAQELANRLGMSYSNDRLTSRATLTDGTNEIIICPGMYNLMVNRRMLNMDSRAESRGGDVYVPDSVLAAIRGYIRPGSAFSSPASSYEPPVTRSASPVVPAAPRASYYSSRPAAPSYTPDLTYQPMASGRYKVVIDPGHGGKDPGAIGPGGLREKTVNLGVGLALRDVLQFRGLSAVMTRQDDTFIELEERAAICNRAQGDVYVSLHANSSSSSASTGSEIYFVDDKGEYTAIARGVAAARTMDIAPRALGCNLGLDLISKQILFGALLEEYRIESRELASYIMGSLGGHMISYGRGIYGNKGLRVLRFTRCPGVLVEVGFLSNPQTERILQQEYYRRSLAESIAEGIMRFKLAQDQTACYTR